VTAGATYRRLAADLERVPPRAVEEASKIVKRGLTASAKAATGGDGRFSRAPWARLTVNVDVRAFTGDEAVAEITPAKRSGGPWRWIEDGTRPHPIGARKHLRLGREWIIGPVQHPGSRGKQAWTEAVDRTQDAAIEAMRREALEVIG
jgi:hypothetical protein